MMAEEKVVLSSEAVRRVRNTVRAQKVKLNEAPISKRHPRSVLFVKATEGCNAESEVVDAVVEVPWNVPDAQKKRVKIRGDVGHYVQEDVVSVAVPYGKDNAGNSIFSVFSTRQVVWAQLDSELSAKGTPVNATVLKPTESGFTPTTKKILVMDVLGWTVPASKVVACVRHATSSSGEPIYVPIAAEC